jgi:flagellar basal-body rod protein FlgB
MNLSALLTDNVTEILFKIIEFTQARQKILLQNIINVRVSGFVPLELQVDEFSDLLKLAIEEHVQNDRLVLQDTDNIKFGLSGSFEAKPVVDEQSKELREENQHEYLKLQFQKLEENMFNHRFAAELLKNSQGTIPV